MTPFDIFGLIILFAVLIHYVNDLFFHIQTTIAITIGAAFVVLILALMEVTGTHAPVNALRHILTTINFKELLLNGMLGALLFAGAMSIESSRLLKFKWEISTLALVSTISSTLIVGAGFYGLSHLLHFPLPLPICFVFGALISPTDPVAILATLKETKAPKDISIKIAGESLFNDGVGLVLFVTCYELAFSSHNPTAIETIDIFLRQSIGGIGYGLLLAGMTYLAIKPVRSAKLEILITVCIATAGYALAQDIDISGPLAMVVAGLLIGNPIKKECFTQRGKEYLSVFWELIEELLNAMLFLLIGLELLAMTWSTSALLLGLLAIPLTLGSRWFTVLIPMAIFKTKRQYSPHIVRLLTWGGLRGGLALAMALSLPQSPNRATILTTTYCIVLFSIIVQGLSIKSYVNRIFPSEAEE